MSDAEPITSIWQYEPNYPLAIAGTVLYGLLFLIIGYQTLFSYRAWFFIPVVIGAAIEVVGYAMRAYSTQNQMEIGPFVVTLILVVLAPIFIAAGNFMLVGRLVRSVLPPDRHTIFGIPARWITRVFVTCDVVGFIIQGNGSAVASSDNWQGPNKDIGEKVLIAGLAFQFVAFSVYLCLLVRFHLTAKRFAVEAAPAGWINVVRAVYISSSMIMVRCLFRVVEFAEGTEGYAFKNEWMFYVFETLPMLIAIAIFCLWHPSKYLGRDGAKALIANTGNDVEGHLMEDTRGTWSRRFSRKPKA